MGEPAVDAGMHVVPGVEIAFRDGSGMNWVRRVDGLLEELGTNPVRHYQLEQPLGWGSVEPA